MLYIERDQGFAEPGALSSTSPTDLPLPRTAPRESFVLVASRARRSGNLRCRGRRVQGDPTTETPQIANDWRADEPTGTWSSPAPARGSGARSPSGWQRDGAAVTLLARDREPPRGDGRVDRAATPWSTVRHPRPQGRRRGVRRRRARARACPRARRLQRHRRGERRGRRRRGPLRRPRRDEPQRARTTACRAALRTSRRGPGRATSSSCRRSSRGSPCPGYTGYSASKAGLLGLVRSFAAELAPDDVQVNAICPGWVDTDMAWHGLDAIAAATGGTRGRRLPRRDARGAARADVATGGHRRHRRLAALAGRARHHRAGDRPERRRLDGLSGAALSPRRDPAG